MANETSHYDPLKSAIASIPDSGIKRTYRDFYETLLASEIPFLLFNPTTAEQKNQELRTIFEGDDIKIYTLQPVHLDPLDLNFDGNTEGGEKTNG